MTASKHSPGLHQLFHMKHFNNDLSDSQAMTQQNQNSTTQSSFVKVSNSPRKEVLKKHQTENKFNRWQEKFRERSFYEKYQVLAKLSFGVSWFFNLLSIAGGVLFVAALLAGFIYPDIKRMAIPALLLLIIVELVKRIILTNWIVEYLRSKTTNKVLIFANVVFVVLSAGASVGGGIELVQMTRGKQKPTLIHLKSIEQKYQHKIAQVQRDRRVLEKSNTYLGNTYYSPADRKLDNKHLSKINALEAAQKKAIAQATKTNQQKLHHHQKGTDEYLWTFMVIALLIEIFSIVSIVFPVYFKYRAITDQDILAGNTQLVKFDIRGLHALINSTIQLPHNLNSGNYPALDTQALASNPNTKPLGFKYYPSPTWQSPEKEVNKAEATKYCKKTPVFPDQKKQPKPKDQTAPKPLPNNTLPLFPVEVTQALEGVEQYLTSTGSDTVATSPKTAVPPTPPRKRGRGTSLNYQVIDQLIYEGKLSNFDIAQKANCAESSITKRRRWLKNNGNKANAKK